MLFQVFSLSLAIRRATNQVVEPGISRRASGDQDHSGRGVAKPISIPLHVDETGILLPEFPNSLAHSLWRSQELTLLRRVAEKADGPVLDFGCGDGSFATLMYPKGEQIAWGVDIDPVALEIAAKYQIYDKLVTFDRMADIPAVSVGFVFSCSVLEHTVDLPACLSAIARVMRRGGLFAFTVPSDGFTRQMAQLVDASFADSANEKMYHRNLMPAEDWHQLLTKTGLEVVEQRSFQSAVFTRMYFGLTSLNIHQLGRIPFVTKIAGWAMRKRLQNLVRESLTAHDPAGANHFFLARKPL